MVEPFDEHSETGQGVVLLVQRLLQVLEKIYGIHFREPHHDIASQLLNHISEFTREAGED
ncbi:hypothetical protein LCGC14_3038960 [marine sediment metagenome]|uniref:Uncharacterized protein n=1 Tax=marine sediment metagenome TaxID=412755 RepID=A0A0F8ZG49_9ZZZZ